MKQTAVEKLVAHLIEYGFDLSAHKLEIEQAKEMEKQQKDSFAIEFGEWLCEKANVPYIKGTMDKTLEIFKNK